MHSKVRGDCFEKNISIVLDKRRNVNYKYLVATYHNAISSSDLNIAHATVTLWLARDGWFVRFNANGNLAT